MVDKLKEILKDDEDEESPTIIILDSNQKVQYRSDQNSWDMIDSGRMVEVPSLEVTIERTKKSKKAEQPRASSKASTDCSDDEMSQLKAPKKPKRKSSIKAIWSNTISYANSAKYEKAMKF